jgi:hypothetical protein
MEHLEIVRLRPLLALRASSQAAAGGGVFSMQPDRKSGTEAASGGCV